MDAEVRTSVTIGSTGSVLINLLILCRGGTAAGVIKAVAEAKLSELQAQIWADVREIAPAGLTESELRAWAYAQIGFEPK